MAGKNTQLNSSPSGLKTWLPSDVEKQEFITNQLIELYRSFGYGPIEIPTLVGIDVVEKANKKFTQEVFKLVDRDGKTLALRTELTQPIAKAVAARADELEFPLRLYYNSSIFRYRGIATDESREIQQIGVEYIGAAQAQSFSEHEILHLVIKSMQMLNITEFELILTDASIWNKVFEKYPDIGKQAYDLLLQNDYLEFKNLIPESHPLRFLLGTNNIDEVSSALDLDLALLADLLEMSTNIKFDPAQCPDLALYTGLHFNLMAAGEGKLVAMGGRYDNLLDSFGVSKPAIGFAFYLPKLLSILDRDSSIKVVGGSKETLEAANTWQETLAQAEKAIANGKRIEIQ